MRIMPHDEPVITTRHQTCGHCGIRVEFEEKDMRVHQIEGTWVNCPNCNRPIDIHYFNS